MRYLITCSACDTDLELVKIEEEIGEVIKEYRCPYCEIVYRLHYEYTRKDTIEDEQLPTANI
jgi:DNA-directed RNA polymerase subunit RPC12/RpoP